MAISVSVQLNGGLLPDIILSTQGYYHRGNPFKCHVEVLSLHFYLMTVITLYIARVRINRVRLPILLVVS